LEVEMIVIDSMPSDHTYKVCKGCLRRLESEPVNEDRCKFLAELMMLGLDRRVVVPTGEEWIGLNLLERDDHLKRRTR